MYGKLEDNKLIYAPRNLTTKEHKIINFNKNTILMEQYGFKKVIDIKPEYDSSTHYLSIDGYAESENNIIINYKINEIEINNEPTLEERVAELEKNNKEQSKLIKTLLSSANLMELE